MSSHLFTYAVGDIYGDHAVLTTLLDRIHEHADGEDYRLVFLGNTIDHGPNGAAVLYALRAMELRAPDRVVVLRGWHEQLMAEAARDDTSFAAWMRHGGQATLRSFQATRLSEVPRDLLDWVTRRPPEWHDALRRYVGDPELALSAGQPGAAGLHLVHGGTAGHDRGDFTRPRELDGITDIDTGAGLGGYLTAAIFTDSQAEPIGYFQAADQGHVRFLKPAAKPATVLEFRQALRSTAGVPETASDWAIRQNADVVAAQVANRQSALRRRKVWAAAAAIVVAVGGSALLMPPALEFVTRAMAPEETAPVTAAPVVVADAAKVPDRLPSAGPVTPPAAAVTGDGGTTVIDRTQAAAAPAANSTPAPPAPGAPAAPDAPADPPTPAAVPASDGAPTAAAPAAPSAEPAGLAEAGRFPVPPAAAPEPEPGPASPSSVSPAAVAEVAAPAPVAGPAPPPGAAEVSGSPNPATPAVPEVPAVTAGPVTPAEPALPGAPVVATAPETAAAPASSEAPTAADVKAASAPPATDAPGAADPAPATAAAVPPAPEAPVAAAPGSLASLSAPEPPTEAKPADPAPAGKPDAVAKARPEPAMPPAEENPAGGARVADVPPVPAVPAASEPPPAAAPPAVAAAQPAADDLPTASAPRATRPDDGEAPDPVVPAQGSAPTAREPVVVARAPAAVATVGEAPEPAAESSAVKDRPLGTSFSLSIEPWHLLGWEITGLPATVPGLVPALPQAASVEVPSLPETLLGPAMPDGPDVPLPPARPKLFPRAAKPTVHRAPARPRQTSQPNRRLSSAAPATDPIDLRVLVTTPIPHPPQDPSPARRRPGEGPSRVVPAPAP